ncbi:MAG: indole-3-glycerol-phosphate synthase, partial [Niameybacter sp.]
EYKYLSAIKKEVRVALLDKDFIFDVWQVYKAKAMGADAILLIATMIDKATLSNLYKLAKALKMDVLVEVHNEIDLEKALDIGADIIGINNRDLYSFNVELETTLRLRSKVPPDKIVVSESGIHTKESIYLMKTAKVDAVLVGESFVTAKDVKAKIKAFSEEAELHRYRL